MVQTLTGGVRVRVAPLVLMVQDCGRREASESARRSMITCLRNFRKMDLSF